MKANEINSRAVMFIKKYGWEYAKHILNEDSVILVDLDYTRLKRLVESHELVEKHSGLMSARKYIKFLRSSVDIGLYHGLDDVDCKTEIPLIEQAIKDVESCL